MNKDYIRVKEEIEKLNRKLKFYEDNEDKLSVLGDDYLLVDYGKNYGILIKVNSLEEISKVTKAFPADKSIENNIKSASGKEWINHSPYLIKTEPYRCEYSHLDHYFNISYSHSDDLCITIEVNINLAIDGVGLLNFISEPTEETKHRKVHVKYHVIQRIKEDILPLRSVGFYGGSIYYYASNEEEANAIINILNIHKGE